MTSEENATGNYGDSIKLKENIYRAALFLLPISGAISCFASGSFGESAAPVFLGYSVIAFSIMLFLLIRVTRRSEKELKEDMGHA